LSQETFLRLSANTDLRRIHNLRGYLFTTARHLLIDSRRRTRRRAAGLEDLMSAAADPPATPSGERFVMAAEQLAIVTESLRELPPLCRCIFYLSRFEGLRHREIAERLDISVRTVEANLQRAVLHCTRTLRERNGYRV
ncbi:MAG: RNA polymerase sigma factor, partial [Gammaproteobacteria bacterium]